MTLTVRRFLFTFRLYFLSRLYCKILFGASLFFVTIVLLSAGIRILQMDSHMIGARLLFKSTITTTTTLKTPIYLTPERLKQMMINKKNNNLVSVKEKEGEMKRRMWMDKVERLNRLRNKPVMRHVEVEGSVRINYNIHVFYYAWYENEFFDGNWQHWNHEYLSNWKKNDFRVYPTGRHVPPDDIGSNFYPRLGCYSSRDPLVVDIHMKQIRDAGIGVLIVSWYPPGMSDGSARSPDTVFKQLLDAAEKYYLKVAPHIEPYNNRNPFNLLKHLKYFTSTYGNHPALYKMKKKGRELIVYYIYDSYRTPAFVWREVMDANGNMTLRGTPEDGIFLGLLVDPEHKNEIKRARFDGFYTYFASNGFTYGSTWKNWRTLSTFANIQKLIFIPSVGPGYIDTRVRPWNSANTRHRRNGQYYEVAWRAAIRASVSQISITSFNEWHEGTQIEPAIPKSITNYTYLDYEPEGSDFYLNLTNFWIRQFTGQVLRSGPLL